ncbi:MAG: hypothetical protein OES57_12185, partial [Acidimicrobiia bacterium]|nr:hypothetical protein [Acidimicrobiia bacterium]
TAGHHVTTLFGSVFFLGPVVARVLIDDIRAPLPDDTSGHRHRPTPALLWPLVARRLRRIAPATIRVAVLGVLVVAALAVVLPYWIWSSSDPIVQAPIPHGSRSNFIDDPNAGLVFWLVPWFPVVLALPLVLVRGLMDRAWPLAASVALLTLLGTGGTTPIPRLLLGGAFDILTLDRFTFWATIAVLPLVGRLVASAVDGRVAAAVSSWSGPSLHRLVLCSAGLVLIGGFLFSATLGRFRTLQPDPIDPAPIAEFMAKDQHDRWRYLTLGFGDQMAWVSANTTATTVDGNYHSARRLPELVSRPVERLEGAKFRGVPGIGSLQQFVTTPQRYNLKFVFANDEFYDPLLFATGWQRVGDLRNGVEVWERADVPPLPPVLPGRELPALQRLLWGLVPLTAIAAAAAAHVWSWRGEPVPAWLRASIGTRPPAGVRSTRRLRERLRRASQKLTGKEPQAPLQWSLRRRLSRWRRRVEAAPSRRTARVVTAGLVLVVGLAATVGWSIAAPTDAVGPAQVVHDYYDDLDFRRFESAWGRLDPQTRVDRNQYLLDLSVVDGLVASYAKIDRIEIGAVRLDGEISEVDVRLRYLTAVEAYDVERTHAMVRRDGRWYLSPPASAEPVPAQQFVRNTEVRYLDLGRRIQTTDDTAYGDVLDRPRIEVLDSQLVRHQDRWHIVGQVTNVDVDPADITVTGRLRGADGALLASYDGGQATVSKVRPGETVPFRVDFEGVAGATDLADPTAGDFDPDATTDLALREAVASYDLVVRAVVTATDLERLGVGELRLEPDGSWRLRGRLHNDLTTTATLPIVTVAQLDERGAVRWVDLHYLADGIRPQRSGGFSMPLTDPRDVELIDLPAVVYDNGRTDQADAAFAPPPSLEVGHRDVGALHVVTRAFLRERTP